MECGRCGEVFEDGWDASCDCQDYDQADDDIMDEPNDDTDWGDTDYD